jgi:hypothetical protein
MNSRRNQLAELRRATEERRGRSRVLARPFRTDLWPWIMMASTGLVACIMVIAIRWIGIFAKHGG